MQRSNKLPTIPVKRRQSDRPMVHFLTVPPSFERLEFDRTRVGPPLGPLTLAALAMRQGWDALAIDTSVSKFAGHPSRLGRH